jgi:hypothetical protein
MKQIKFSLLVILGFSMFIIQKVYAAQTQNKDRDLYIGGTVGFLAPDNGTLTANIMSGGEIGIAKDFFGFSIRGMYYQSDFHSNLPGSSPKVGLIPISFTPYFQRHIENTPILSLPITLKMGGGPSYIASSYSKNYSTSNNDDSGSVQIDRQISNELENTFGLHLLCGFDLKISKHFSIGTDITYFFLNPAMSSTSILKVTNITNTPVTLGRPFNGIVLNSKGDSATNQTSSTENLKLNSLIVTAALKFHF